MEFEPGKLEQVGACAIAPGGCVGNVGVALKRLGADVALCGKYGDDPMGRLLGDILAGEGVRPANPPSPDLATSYTVVLNPPGEDRMFLHCPGANEEFTGDDVPDSLLAKTRILHLGYPPLLRRLYQDPDEVRRLFERAHSFGVFTSLDMAMPDSNSDAARQLDWADWLAPVLPVTDLFCPSADELAFMYRTEVESDCDLRAMGAMLTEHGLKNLLIKRGSHGIFVWDGFGKTLHTVTEPCFEANVVGTTGAGDATVAGFLFARLRGADLNEAARIATAVGACSVEGPDATSGIPAWPELEKRLNSGWKKLA